MWSWILEAYVIFAREWRAEWRSRVALNTVGLFALSTLVTISIALGPVGVDSSERGSFLPVILWIILLFSAFAGLPRAFVAEEESGTALALRLTATPSTLFVGKATWALSLLLAVEIVLVPLFLAFVQLTVDDPLSLIWALLLGAWGLAVVSTLIAAMVAQSEVKGSLFPILGLPLLLPLLLLAVSLTRASITGGADPQAFTQILLYNGSITVAGLMLFPVIWKP